MTGNWKMRKTAGNKIKAIIEKEVADSCCSSNKTIVLNKQIVQKLNYH